MVNCQLSIQQGCMKFSFVHACGIIVIISQLTIELVTVLDQFAIDTWHMHVDALINYIM